MNMKNILLITLLFPIFLFGQEVEPSLNTLKTNAKITNIETKRSGRSVKNIATISFTTEQGKNIETMVELLRIPFLGSFKSVGDEISINYNVENPALVETVYGNFLSKYGMYILIFLGIIFSIKSLLKARNHNKS